MYVHTIFMPRHQRRPYSGLTCTWEDAAEGHVFPSVDKSMGLAVFHPILDLIEERIKPLPPDHQ